MNKIESHWLALKQLDELAAQNTVIHSLHPITKVLTTIMYLLAVTSFSRYEVTALIPLFFYPVVLMSLAELPYQSIIKRLLPALPFILFIGIFNPFFDTAPLVQAGSISISYGWVSFISLMMRSLLSISAALLLLATTGIEEICLALFSLKVPRLLILQILFMYRYLYVLVEEFIRTARAYSFRSLQGEGIAYKAWGSLLGQLLLRTLDRAQNIYAAMLCRGFSGEFILLRNKTFTWLDILFFVCWTAFFAASRLFNIPQWLGTLLIGGSL